MSERSESELEDDVRARRLDKNQRGAKADKWRNSESVEYYDKLEPFKVARVNKAISKRPKADLYSVEVINPERQPSAVKKTKKTNNWVPSGGPTRLQAGINDVYKEPTKIPIRRKKISRN